MSTETYNKVLLWKERIQNLELRLKYARAELYSAEGEHRRTQKGEIVKCPWKDNNLIDRSECRECEEMKREIACISLPDSFFD